MYPILLRLAIFSFSFTAGLAQADPTCIPEDSQSWQYCCNEESADLRQKCQQKKKQLQQARQDFFKVLRCVWRDSQLGIEAAGWVVKVSQGDFQYRVVDFKSGNAHSATTTCNRSAVAQVHTHPRGLSPQPSTTGEVNDQLAAAACKVTVYVVYTDAIWYVLPGLGMQGDPIVEEVKVEDWKKATEDLKCDGRGNPTR